MEQEIRADGNAYRDINLETPERISEAAKVWSEGRKSLEELLLFCMENNIKTVACCAGHENLGFGGYIGFNMNDTKTKEIITALMSLEFSQKQEITTLITRENSNPENAEISAYFHNQKDADDATFSRLLQEIKDLTKGKKVELDYRVEKMQELAEVESSKDLKLQLIYENKEDKFSSYLEIDKQLVRGYEEVKFDTGLGIIDLIKEDISPKKKGILDVFSTKIREGQVRSATETMKTFVKNFLGLNKNTEEKVR